MGSSTSLPPSSQTSNTPTRRRAKRKAREATVESSTSQPAVEGVEHTCTGGFIPSDLPYEAPLPTEVTPAGQHALSPPVEQVDTPSAKNRNDVDTPQDRHRKPWPKKRMIRPYRHYMTDQLRPFSPAGEKGTRIAQRCSTSSGMQRGHPVLEPIRTDLEKRQGDKGHYLLDVQNLLWYVCSTARSRFGIVGDGSWCLWASW